MSIIVPLLFVLVLAAYIIGIPVGRMSYARAMKDFAARRKLEYLKWDILDFPTNLLDDLPSWDKAHNVYIGHEGRDLLMVFEIKCGWGNQTYNRTVVARRFPRVTKDAPRIPDGYLFFENDTWRVITQQRRVFWPMGRWPSGATLEPKTIEQLWNLLA